MKYFMIPSDKDLEKYKEELVLPLLNYSIGFDIYFTSEEIIKISKIRKVNVIINRLLHKNDIDSIKGIIDSLKESVSLFIVEDLGLVNIIDKDKLVLYQNHILNNYDSVNYFNSLGIKNVVVNNDLTTLEIEEIVSKTNSNLFIFGINKNNIMYSRRKLLSSFKDFKNDQSISNYNVITEEVSKKDLIIKEEEGGTTIFTKEIFSINNYLDVFSSFNVIINFSNFNDEEKEIVLNNYSNKELNKMINADDYFLRNKIIYKLGVK